MDSLLVWIVNWLPLIQGFAALASIAGASLSWKYALKAQRAREEMTQNIVSARVVERLDFTLSELRNFRTLAILPDGNPDHLKYQAASQSHKHLLEETLGVMRAAEPYMRKRVERLDYTVEKLVEAAYDPTFAKIEVISKRLSIATEGLRLDASTRVLGLSK